MSLVPRSARLVVALVAPLVLTLTACTQSGDDPSDDDSSDAVSAPAIDPGEVDPDDAEPITLDDGASASDAAGVSIDGDVVTVTDPGTYAVSGTLSEGQLVVDSPGTVVLLLENARIRSRTGSPVLVQQAEEVVLVLGESSQNRFTLAGAQDATSPDREVSAALGVRSRLTLGGTGTLSLRSTAVGLHTTGDLVISGGALRVDSDDVGLSSEGSITIDGGATTVDGPNASEGASGSEAARTSALRAERLLLSSGTLLALGSAAVTESPSPDSQQAWVQADLGFARDGQLVAVLDTGANGIALQVLTNPASHLLYASDALTREAAYTVSVDGEVVDEVTAQ